MQAERQKHESSMQARRAKNSETVSQLKRENDKLRSELALLTVPGAGSTIAKLEEQDRLAQMKLEIKSLERRIGHEANLGNDYDKSIQVVRMETLKVRQGMKGNNVTTDRVAAVDKQVRLLENRLDQALVDFNKALAVNRGLRERIDSLRDERDTFKQIYDRLEAQLHGRKRAMALLIERSNEDYEACDKAQQDLVNLQQIVDEDRTRYSDESRKLEDLMTRYKAAREQQQQQLIQEKANQAAEQAKKRAAKSLRGNRRMLAALTGSTTLLSGGGSGANHQSGSNAPDSPTRGGRGGAAGGGNSPNSDRGDSAAVAEDDPNHLQDIIEKLKDATGVQDLDALYQTFVQAEESNFSTFNFVNELNTERDHLESEIAKLRDELASRRSESDRHATLKGLENELARTEHATEQTQKRTDMLKEVLGQVRVVAERIFTSIGCSQSDAVEILGTASCTELNMTKFFGIIENRVNAILYAAQMGEQNEARRKIARDDEQRRKRERKAAGGAGGEADDDDGAGTVTTTSEVQNGQVGGAGGERYRYVGLAPEKPPGTVNYDYLRGNLPSCNPSDNRDDKLEDNEPLDPAKLRSEYVEKWEQEKVGQQQGRRHGRGRRGRGH